MRCFFLRLIQLFCIFTVLLGIFIGLFPRLMSTDWGRKQIENRVNQFIAGKIEFQSCQLQWTKSQIIRGLILKDPQGEEILKVNRLSIDIPFWKILMQRIHGGIIQIKDLSGNLAIDELGQTNVAYALGLVSTQGRGSISQFAFSDVNAHMHLVANYHHFVLWARGLTRQDNREGVFELDVVLNGLRLSNWKYAMDDIQHYFYGEGSRRAAIQLKIVNFPTDVIDRLWSNRLFQSKRFFRLLMGSYVNIDLTKEPNADGCMNLKVHSPFVQGEINGRIAKGAFTLQEPAHFHWDVNTEFLKAYAHPQIQLYQLAQIDITAPYLFIPLALFNPQTESDFCHCGFKIDIALGKTEGNFHPLGLLNIHHLTTQLSSKSNQSRLFLKSTGFLEHNHESIHIDFERSFSTHSDLSSFLNELAESNFHKSN